MTDHTFSYSFNFNDKDVESINQAAEEFQKYYKESGTNFEDRPYTAFLQDGHHTFRIYPDRDSKGFARIVRRIWVHKGLPVGEKKKVWVWSDRRVDDILDELKEGGMNNFLGKQTWQYKTNELGLCCIRMIDTPDKEWHPNGITFVAILQKKDIFALQDFIAELHPEDKRKLLDPNLDTFGLKISKVRGSGKSNTSVGIAGTAQYHLPPPVLVVSTEEGFEPKYPFTGLDEIYIKESDKLSDEDFFEFKKLAYSELQKFKAQSSQATDATALGHKINPDSGSVTQLLGETSFEAKAIQSERKPEKATGSPPRGEAVQPIRDGKVCKLANKILQVPSMADQYGKDIRFGNRPDKQNPWCMICNLEEECITETAKMRTA